MREPDSKVEQTLGLLRGQRWPGAEVNRELEVRLMTTNFATGPGRLPRWAFLAGAGLLLAGTALGAAAYRYFETAYFVSEDGEQIQMQMDAQPQADGSFKVIGADGKEGLWVPAPDSKTTGETMEFRTDDGKVFQIPKGMKMEPAPAEKPETAKPAPKK